MYIYNYFIILLGVCVSYDTRSIRYTIQKNQKLIHDTIHDLTTMPQLHGFWV